MKSIDDQVFPVAGYTDLIQSTIEQTFSDRYWLTFTRRELQSSIEQTLRWLKNSSERNSRQETTLTHIVSTSIRRLIQLGKIKKVKSKLTTEATWQWTVGIDSAVYRNITSDECVAKDASKIGNRAKNLKQLHEINKLAVTA